MLVIVGNSMDDFILDLDVLTLSQTSKISNTELYLESNTVLQGLMVDRVKYKMKQNMVDSIMDCIRIVDSPDPTFDGIVLKANLHIGSELFKSFKEPLTKTMDKLEDANLKVYEQQIEIDHLKAKHKRLQTQFNVMGLLSFILFIEFVILNLKR